MARPEQERRRNKTRMLDTNEKKKNGIEVDSGLATPLSSIIQWRKKEEQSG
jgi:hypothetical protein